MEDNMAEQIKNYLGSENAERFKNTDNVGHLRFMVDSTGFGGPGFANMFFGMKQKAYIARGKEVFITSDSPVVEKWLPPAGFYGASFFERDKYFTLTPKIFLKLTYPGGAKKVKRKTLYKNQDDIVKAFNIIIVSGAQKFVYSGNRMCLEQLLDGSRNPGRLEREYIEKHVKPWAEYRMRMKR